MTRTIVLGAGFGGITAARELSSGLPESHEVVLVDRATHFLMGLAKLWALDGRRPLEEGRRPLSNLRPANIDHVRGAVEQIDIEGKRVTVAGDALTYDQLVVALGAQLDPTLVPGLEHAINLYSPAGVEALATELHGIDEGRVLFVIAGTPLKCPPAPYEAAILAADVLAARGVADRVDIRFTTPEPRPLPVAPTSCGQLIVREAQARGITITTSVKPVRVLGGVDGKPGQVEYDESTREEFDLLVAVPPHVPPRVLVDAGLARPGGWVQVDPRTLATSTPRVWAVGDAASVLGPSGKPVPKAGVFAEAQARVVAANLVDAARGQPAKGRFDGKGHCYVELGGRRASAIRGDFFADPAPVVTMDAPSAATLTEKEQFEAERLAAWFGR